jgi:hypothetical protein
MPQERTWQTAESQEEFITDIVEGALREIEDDNEISNTFQGTEYEGKLSEVYEPKSMYGNPLEDMRHNSIEDKPVPAGTVDYLKKGDTVYKGVATATRSGIEKMMDDTGRDLDDYEPIRLLEHIIGIIWEIASRIEIQLWSNETDAIFFNDPVYIRSEVRS